MAVWAGILATLPLLSGSPWTEHYADLVPIDLPYVASPAALPVAILMSIPAGITMYMKRSYIWKTNVTVRAIVGLLMLACMGGIAPGDMLVVLAAAAASSAAPCMVRGWRASRLDTSLFMLAGIVTVPLSYAYLPYAVPVLLALIFACLVAAGLAGRRSEATVEPPPGFDWRNTPNERHPGGELCGCPCHRNRRENPGVLQLCADCMEVFRTRPAWLALSRRVRFILWVMRNISVHYIDIRQVSDSDDCHFCGSRRGGLRGRVVPPPDAR